MKNWKKFVLFAMLFALIATLSGCAFFKSKVQTIKGSIVGATYTADFYDNYGVPFLTASGKKIDISGNSISESGYTSDGKLTTNYTLSSVITITIDGNEMQSCGSTIIFAEDGLKKDVDFNITDIDGSSHGITTLTSVAKFLNNYKNLFGKSRVVVIQSQLGVPICAYSGDEVYWEIPEDLPKMTKLMIDGKALYIHRANFQIIDKDLIK